MVASFAARIKYRLRVTSCGRPRATAEVYSKDSVLSTECRSAPPDGYRHSWVFRQGI